MLILLQVVPQSLFLALSRELRRLLLAPPLLLLLLALLCTLRRMRPLLLLQLRAPPLLRLLLPLFRLRPQPLLFRFLDRLFLQGLAARRGRHSSLALSAGVASLVHALPRPCFAVVLRLLAGDVRLVAQQKI